MTAKLSSSLYRPTARERTRLLAVATAVALAPANGRSGPARDTERAMSQENVELVERQIGDGDLAGVLRDDTTWATRMRAIEAGFVEDFEFVVRAR
jgi:hypothetical protein